MNILLLVYEDCKIERKDVPTLYSNVAHRISEDYNNIIEAILSHNIEINDKDVIISVKRLSDEISFKDYDKILFSVELLYDYYNPIYIEYVKNHHNNTYLEKDREYIGFSGNSFSISSGSKIEYNKVYNSMIKHEENFLQLMNGVLDVDIIITYNPYINYSDRLKFNPLELFKITKGIKLDFCDSTFFDETVLKKSFIQRKMLKTGIHTELKSKLKLKMSKNSIGLIYCTERLLIMPTLLPEYISLSEDENNDKYVQYCNEFDMPKSGEYIYSLLFEEKIPKWVKEVDFSIYNDLLCELKKTENDIKQLKNDYETIKCRLHEMDMLKNILNHKGKSLERDVSQILSNILEIEIDFEEDGDGDIIFTMDNVKYIIEIKGVNTSVKKSHVAQLIQHVSAEEDNDVESGNSFEYKGVLMINPFIDQNIKDRVEKNYYDQRIEKEIMNNNFCAIDVPTLLGIYSKFLKNEIDKHFLIDKLNNNIYIDHDYLVK